MPHSFIQASNLGELATQLNGGVVGGKSITRSQGKLQGLHGLTLIINTSTVSFSDANGAGIPLLGTGSIKALIEAAVAGVQVAYSDEKLVLTHASGVTVDKDGTANTLFGFDDSADTVGVLYAALDGAVPRVLNVSAGARMDSFFAYVEVA